VYAERKRANIPLSNLGVKVKEGTLLELQWTAGTDGSIVVVGSRIIDRQSLKGISYIQVVEGKISKRENNAFAFIKKGNLQCYIRAEIIQNQHVNDNDDAVVIAVLDYNKKKDSWNWNCVTLQKLKR
jgi:hypothetical protein